MLLYYDQFSIYITFDLYALTTVGLVEVVTKTLLYKKAPKLTSSVSSPQLDFSCLVCFTTVLSPLAQLILCPLHMMMCQAKDSQTTLFVTLKHLYPLHIY